MSRLVTAGLAGGVFVVLFATTWVVAPRLQGVSSAAATIETSARKEARRADWPRVGVSFAQARKQAGPSKPMTAEELTAQNLEDDQSLALVSQMTGVRLPPDLVASARNDGPSSRNYIRFAQIKAADGGTIGCMSALGEEKGRVEHMVTRYSATEVDDDGPNLPTLADYVESGCAAAMRDHSSQLTLVQYYQKRAGLLPKTAKFDAERRELAEAIRNFQPH